MRVPEAQRQMGPAELPGVRQDIRVGPDNFLGGAAAFAEQGANALQHVSRAALEMHARQVQEADLTRAQDAVNQFESRRQDRLFGQNGAFSVRGADVFTQQNSKPLTDSVVDDLHQDFSEIAGTLGNDEQKRLFAEHAQPAISHTRGQLLQHEAEQYRVYQRGVGVSAIDTHQKSIGLNYNNPDSIRQSLDAIHTASVDLGRLEGYPEAYGAAQGQKHVSDALAGAINAALTKNDHASATKILHDFSKDMDTNDMLKAYETITKSRDARLSFGAAQNVMSSIYPKMNTSDADRAFNITFNAESGGNHFDKSGNVITSPKGAVGIAQVMPETGPEAARLAGVPWDETRFRNDPGYNATLGKAYFRKQLDDFHGDLGMAWAAYNAGPGAAKAAIEKAGREGGDWLKFLPKETQAYVARNLNAFAAGEGRFQRPTLAEAIAAADAQLGPDAMPQFRKQVRDEVASQFELQEKALKQRDEENTAEAMRQLLANGGKFSALPMAVRAAVPLDKADNVMDFARKISEGEPVKTDFDLYYKLKLDSGLLRNTNLMAFRDRLNDTEFKQLVNEQQGMVSGGGSHTETRTARDILNGFMREAGIDPTPKDSDREGAARVGRIWSAFEQRIGDAEREKGGKLSGEDIQKVAARMFTKVGVRGILYGSSDKPAVLVDWREDKVVIPDADRTKIIEAWRQARPGQAISEDDVFYMYMKHKGLL